MAEWYDKKLSDLSEEDKFDMLGEMKELLEEFYKTTKYGKIDDVKLIAKTNGSLFNLVFNLKTKRRSARGVLINGNSQ